MFEQIKAKLADEAFRATVKEVVITAATAIAVAVVITAAKNGIRMLADKIEETNDINAA